MPCATTTYAQQDRDRFGVPSATSAVTLNKACGGSGQALGTGGSHSGSTPERFGSRPQTLALVSGLVAAAMGQLRSFGRMWLDERLLSLDHSEPPGCMHLHAAPRLAMGPRG